MKSIWQNEWDKNIKLLYGICQNVSVQIKISKLWQHQETTLFPLRTEDIGLKKLLLIKIQKSTNVLYTRDTECNLEVTFQIADSQIAASI